MKASNEFKVGQHNIGWVSSDFTGYFGDTEFEIKSVPTFQKLPRQMNDATIESELKPGLCGLGDVLAFIDNAPEECKDGYWNLFYFPSFVVSVYWYGGEWDVGAWRRVGGVWHGCRRVFSPANNRSSSCTHCTLCPSCSLALRISELEDWKKKVDKILRVE